MSVFWQMAAQEDRRGPRRKPWSHLATDSFLVEETLRQGAERWLKEKNIQHSTLTPTTFQGAG